MCCAIQRKRAADVRFGSKVDIRLGPRDVRFTPRKRTSDITQAGAREPRYRLSVGAALMGRRSMRPATLAGAAMALPLRQVAARPQARLGTSRTTSRPGSLTAHQRARPWACTGAALRLISTNYRDRDRRDRQSAGFQFARASSSEGRHVAPTQTKAAHQAASRLRESSSYICRRGYSLTLA